MRAVAFQPVPRYVAGVRKDARSFGHTLKVVDVSVFPRAGAGHVFYNVLTGGDSTQIRAIVSIGKFTYKANETMLVIQGADGALV